MAKQQLDYEIINSINKEYIKKFGAYEDIRELLFRKLRENNKDLIKKIDEAEKKFFREGMIEYAMEFGMKSRAIVLEKAKAQQPAILSLEEWSKCAIERFGSLTDKIIEFIGLDKNNLGTNKIYFNDFRSYIEDRLELVREAFYEIDYQGQKAREDYCKKHNISVVDVLTNSPNVTQEEKNEIEKVMKDAGYKKANELIEKYKVLDKDLGNYIKQHVEFGPHLTELLMEYRQKLMAKNSPQQAQNNNSFTQYASKEIKMSLQH